MLACHCICEAWLRGGVSSFKPIVCSRVPCAVPSRRAARPRQIDPLRSLSRQEPDIQAFRCYPIAYNPPRRECPDGTEADDETKQQRWGKVRAQGSWFIFNLSRGC